MGDWVSITMHAWRRYNASIRGRKGVGEVNGMVGPGANLRQGGRASTGRLIKIRRQWPMKVAEHGKKE
jgi:hypothetical protein